MSVFFFRKYFDFALPVVFEETYADLNSQMKPERKGSEEKEQIATCSEIVLFEAGGNEMGVKEVELGEEAGSFNKSTEEVGYSRRKTMPHLVMFKRSHQKFKIETQQQ